MEQTDKEKDAQKIKYALRQLKANWYPPTEDLRNTVRWLSELLVLRSKLEIAEKALHKIAYETLDDGSVAMIALSELERVSIE